MSKKQRETAEHRRLTEGVGEPVPPWRKWGPYVSDRAWATVREDYSPYGTAWDYFPHDLARSKAYRWGEDGIAAWCDRYQLLVFAPAFWNGKDAILKERLFGLVPSEGNHGEDVKELYYHLDGTPTHSYMKYLYKYPQAEFPYGRLIDESRRLGTHEGEFEILDTGVFNDDRYFDVFVEYAKGASNDTCIRIEAWNRGRDPATLHLIPRVWFRNRWAWGATRESEPRITPGPTGKGWISLAADDSTGEPMRNLPFPYALGTTFLYAQEGGRLLFTNNETNCERLYRTASHTRFVKDAFHRHIVNGENCVNPESVGTCAAVHYGALTVPPGKSVVIRLRLTSGRSRDPIGEVDAIVDKRRREADEFYEAIQPPSATEPAVSKNRASRRRTSWRSTAARSRPHLSRRDRRRPRATATPVRRLDRSHGELSDELPRRRPDHNFAGGEAPARGPNMHEWPDHASHVLKRRVALDGLQCWGCPVRY